MYVPWLVCAQPVLHPVWWPVARAASTSHIELFISLLLRLEFKLLFYFNFASIEEVFYTFEAILLFSKTDSV